MTVVLRFYAAAAEAAGTGEETVEGGSVADVLAAARERHGERLGRVLEVCSVLVGDRPAGAADRAAVEVVPGATVEFLPPFAGG